MRTQCNPESMLFARLDRRESGGGFSVVARSPRTPGAAAGRDRQGDQAVDRSPPALTDGRTAGRVVHDVPHAGRPAGVRHRPRYEDLNDPRRSASRSRCSGLFSAGWRRAGRGARPLAGKSTLNRLEHAPVDGNRYRKIAHDPEAIEQLFVDLFLDAHAKAPARINARSGRHGRSRIHGHQEGRFFHGFYGRLLLPAALRVLRRASTGGQAAPLEHRCQRGRDRGESPASSHASARAGQGCASCCAPTAARPRALMAWSRPTRSTTCSVWPATPGWWSRSTRAGLGRGRGGAHRQTARRSPNFRWATRDSWSKRRRVGPRPRDAEPRRGPAPTRGSSHLARRDGGPRQRPL